MAKIRTIYVCQECGHKTTRWMGQCPSCHQWNTLEETIEEPVSKSANNHPARMTGIPDVSPISLSDIPVDKAERNKTGISELDRVLGGGFMPGSFVLLGGDPGVGKSTLTLQIARSRPDLNILYCSGEESAAQIRQRAARLQLQDGNMKVFTDTDLNRVIDAAQKIKPDLLVIDSIQTVYRPEIPNMPGSITQIRECASRLMRLAKQQPCTTLAIGHINKDGELAGPRVLEHMVDAVLQFEGDRNYSYRILRSQKNRFGSVNEIGVFEMSDSGLIEVSNPSQLFLADFDNQVSGNAVVCTVEGSRPLLLEVQALITPSTYQAPQRTTSSLDHRRLSLLLAVLEKRSGFHFANQDVFLNVAGGMRLSETACDAGIIAALISAVVDKPLKSDVAFIGEVGLGAEVRAVSHIDQRIREIKKMGFESVYIPMANHYKRDAKGLKIEEIKTIGDLLKKLF